MKQTWRDKKARASPAIHIDKCRSPLGKESPMTGHQLSGVIAAIATAVDETGAPDCARSTTLARFLLANGCDGLNVLGTTGEATSFSLEERKRVMTAYRDAGLPMER